VGPDAETEMGGDLLATLVSGGAMAGGMGDGGCAEDCADSGTTGTVVDRMGSVQA